MTGEQNPAHCTSHAGYEPGCVWCHSAAVSYAAATRTFPELSDPMLEDDGEDYTNRNFDHEAVIDEDLYGR